MSKIEKIDKAYKVGNVIYESYKQALTAWRKNEIDKMIESTDTYNLRRGDLRGSHYVNLIVENFADIKKVIEHYNEKESGFVEEPIEKPKPPLARIIREADNPEKVCVLCGSSLERRYIFWRTSKCIQPECENYKGE